MTETKPLELYTTDELFEEIARRNTAAAVVCVNVLAPDKIDHWVRFYGGAAFSMGMCEYAKSRIPKIFGEDM